MPARLVTFKIDEALLERLDRYAKRNGLSRSQVIRRAIERFLEGEELKKARVEYLRVF